VREADTESEWYVSGAHARRALGYLGVELAERGDLPDDFEMPVLLDLWGDALTATVDLDDEVPSPVHAPVAEAATEEER
jgi:hypothetical protein